MTSQFVIAASIHKEYNSCFIDEVYRISVIMRMYII